MPLYDRLEIISPAGEIKFYSRLSPPVPTL